MSERQVQSGKRGTTRLRTSLRLPCIHSQENEACWMDPLASFACSRNLLGKAWLHRVCHQKAPAWSRKAIGRSASPICNPTCQNFTRPIHQFKWLSYSKPTINSSFPDRPESLGCCSIARLLIGIQSNTAEHMKLSILGEGSLRQRWHGYLRAKEFRNA